MLERFPTVQIDFADAITTDQMIEVDRIMENDLGISIFQMMENAGGNLAHLARTNFLNNTQKVHNILVMAGNGGNGGGALVAARRLANWGANITVALAKEPHEMTETNIKQINILQKMGVPGSFQKAVGIAPGEQYDLILDGLIGYGLTGAPYGLTAELITQANQLEANVISLDVPSGLSCTDGTRYNPCIQAVATMTIAHPKKGLYKNDFVTGDIYVADISVPPEVLKEVGVDESALPDFSLSDIVKLSL